MKLQIWDTAGEEKFRSLTPMYYKNAEAIILVYDSTNYQTFNNLEKWTKEVEENGKPQVLLVIASTKCDLT